ncbi:MAG TPA: YciI family protein [Magnetospirillum sp.]|jgi:uncharacterized protein YciI|nr:YciI family protein [Magnetospirillum sp.]
MFIVLLTYTVPLDRIDSVVDAHRRWLDGCYAEGVFLASGSQIPRTGGAILAHQVTRARLEALLAQDPFAQAGFATYQIVEMEARKADPRLDFLVE